MVVTIIGMGLIGGSMALSLREHGLSTRIIVVDQNVVHAERALALGLADETMEMVDAINVSDLIIVAVPVDIAVAICPQILDHVTHQMVFDVGSTKSGILHAIHNHPNRGRFVASHPMWGTEFSGPDAAISGAFVGKAVVITDPEHSDKIVLEKIESIFSILGLHILKMSSADHDLHAAYVSHISHITSFALANTVLEKEREEDTIFQLASGGFESTVRLAKSNPAMWVPIFMQNKENVLDVLNEHISQLRKFKSCLEKENYEYLYELIENANRIGKILP